MVPITAPVTPAWTDLYKWTMGHAENITFPDAWAEYRFTNRGKTRFPKGYAEQLQTEIEALGQRTPEPEVLAYTAERAYYLPTSHFEWQKHFRLDPSQVTIGQTGGDLKISIEGPIRTSGYWEVPLLGKVSDTYYKMEGIEPDPHYLERAYEKGRQMLAHELPVVDYATRRAFSPDVHLESVRAIKEGATASDGTCWLIGSSNPVVAYILGINVMGTYAHEWVMAHQGLYGLPMSDRLAMQHWNDVYNGALGTALCDTLGTDYFLEQAFGTVFAKLFDSVRHDSGDPFVFVDKMVAHYRKLRIDPMSKTIIFSDGLNIEKAIIIQKYCAGKIKCAFGIGTNFSNDVGAIPLNIVIKLWSIAANRNARRIPVVKLSDEPGKHTGLPLAIEHALYVVGQKNYWV